MTFDDWLQTVPPEIISDALWARFYEYALGSAREARDWYYKARHVLGDEVALHRMRLIVQVIRQLLKLIPEYRGRSIGEDLAVYEVPSLDQLLRNVPLPDDSKHEIRNTEYEL